jgi:hypothetical protein
MDRSDPEYLNVQDSLMLEAINVIKNGIIRKLASAKKMIDFDKEIAAGIYVYALEELGKLEVLKNALNSNSHLVKYRDAFVWHGEKFPKANDCVKKFNHPECINIGGSFSEKFNDISFTQALEARTKTRLGIFYIDFEYNESNNATNIKKIPVVNEDKLRAAIVGLEDVIKNWK